MPRKVDHDERRRHIVEALLSIAGDRGLDAVSLREVAQEAGVSMGAVQHYFDAKESMLVYALQHWLTMSVHRRFSARVQARAGGFDQDPSVVLRAVLAESLPHDDESRRDARVGLAFLSRGAVDPALAAALRPAFDGFAVALAGLLGRCGVADPSFEGRRLAALVDGLRYAVLLDAVPRADALALLDRHLAAVLH